MGGAVEEGAFGGVGEDGDGPGFEERFEGADVVEMAVGEEDILGRAVAEAVFGGVDDGSGESGDSGVDEDPGSGGVAEEDDVGDGAAFPGEVGAEFVEVVGAVVGGDGGVGEGEGVEDHESWDAGSGWGFRSVTLHLPARVFGM